MALEQVHPKLPMRDLEATRQYYEQSLGFLVIGHYPNYLMVTKDHIELHFFLHATLDPLQNDGQVYIRVSNIDAWYNFLVGRGVAIHPNGLLEDKPWGQREFSLLDPDHNLLTFGELMDKA